LPSSKKTPSKILGGAFYSPHIKALKKQLAPTLRLILNTIFLSFSSKLSKKTKKSIKENFPYPDRFVELTGNTKIS
jgi:hypothetical protein